MSKLFDLGMQIATMAEWGEIFRENRVLFFSFWTFRAIQTWNYWAHEPVFSSSHTHRTTCILNAAFSATHLYLGSVQTPEECHRDLVFNYWYRLFVSKRPKL